MIAFDTDVIAEIQFQAWRQANVRVATHDLRIAATCVAHAAKLITRNRKDFDQVPNLDVDLVSRLTTR